MPAWAGSPCLRNRFDEADHPSGQGRPLTHHRDYYLATDGSVDERGGRLGVIVETIDGITVGAWTRRAGVVDNNDAELKALHWGLDLLADRVPSYATVGVIVDHDRLGQAFGRAVGASHLSAPPVPIPSASQHHWGGILARARTAGAIRVAIVPGESNPAHAVVAGERGHSVRGGDRCVRAVGPAGSLSEPGVRPASRRSSDAI